MARRDWLLRDVASGETLVSATSTWCCFNLKKRRLARFPEETSKVCGGGVGGGGGPSGPLFSNGWRNERGPTLPP